MAVIDNIKSFLGNNKPQEPAQDERPYKAAKKILIVEDESTLQGMYKDKFLAEGFNVITADDGKMGLEKALAEKPHIILLDLMMPVMDGKTMLHKLREFPQFKALPVIVLTNAGDADNIKETQRYDNAADFLIKSNVDINQIVNRVKFWL